MMEWDGLRLATKKGRRCEEGERLSGAVVSRRRMAGVGDGEWLSRFAGGCHMRAEVVRGGEIVARYGTVLSCKVGAAMVVREGLPLVAIRGQKFGE